MTDNITGFGGGQDEINLGLNLNSNVGGSINDFSTLDQVLQQIIKDQETFNGIQIDSLEKAKATTQEIKGSADQAQQLISIFKTLRGEQQGVLGDAKQLASMYQQLNNELQKAVQNKTRMGITSSTVGQSSPGYNAPGSSPGAQSVQTSSVPATQAGGAGGGGRIPPTTSQGPGFAQNPDDFFGKEEINSGARRPANNNSGYADNYAGLDPEDLQNFPYEPSSGEGGTATGGRTTGGPRRGTGSIGRENYKQLSDLAWTIFPNQGYYRNMRRVRWLTRNEGGAINKFVTSSIGKRTGLALNRLGGGQHLRTNEGYQLFPFAQNENGDYVDTQNVPIPGVDNSKPLYGLQNSEGGGWIPGAGLEGTPWNWNGEGSPPSINLPNGTVPTPFNPWQRPNLNATGEGAAKIAGSMYAMRVAKAKGGALFREGQLYTGITGGTGIAGALKYDLGAQATSWFGLNPLESYGQAKQINMQNLSLGYRGNLLNQANSFGNQALQQYGVDPQTSMQMFGQMVMQAGVSLQDLNASLATLAHTASTTNTSFGQLQQNVIQYSQLGSSIGLTGGQNATFATAAAQYSAGQPGLGATGANPANILDSMVGQALVAQQMGTSYLGLPGASQSQGATGLLNGEISANQSLVGRVTGITQGNFNNSKVLANGYQKFKLLMGSIPGMQKEANLSYPNYVKYIHDMYSGKQTKQLNNVLTSNFAQNLGGTAGESAGAAIAGASSPSFIGPKGQRGNSAIVQEMQKVESQNKWKNIGVTVHGKFMGLGEIGSLPPAEQEAMLARIATGDQALSHISQHGKMIQGTYANGTLMDLQGHSKEQFGLYGKTPNLAKMHAAEHKAMQIELGPGASKYFTLMDNPSNFNRHYNRWAKGSGKPTTNTGNTPAGNNNSSPK